MLTRSGIILNWLKREQGQGESAYGLLLGLIVLVVAIAMAALGDDLFTYLGAVIKAVAITWSGGGTA